MKTASSTITVLLLSLFAIPFGAAFLIVGGTVVGTLVGFAVAGGDGARVGAAQDAGQTAILVLLVGITLLGLVLGSLALAKTPLQLGSSSEMGVRTFLIGEYVLITGAMLLYIVVRLPKKPTASPAVTYGTPSQVRSYGNSGAPAPPTKSAAEQHAQRTIDEALGD